MPLPPRLRQRTTARASPASNSLARRLDAIAPLPVTRSLNGTSTGSARTFLRTRINPVLGSATPVAMRRQALIHLLLPRRGSSIMR